MAPNSVSLDRIGDLSLPTNLSATFVGKGGPTSAMRTPCGANPSVTAHKSAQIQSLRIHADKEPIELDEPQPERAKATSCDKASHRAASRGSHQIFCRSLQRRPSVC